MTPPSLSSQLLDPADKTAALAALRAQVRHLEGGSGGSVVSLGVAELDGHLPGGGLALGCLHEIAGTAAGDDGAAVGFATMMLGRLAAGRGRVIWLTRRRDLYPPGLAALGLPPEPLILVPVHRDRDMVWAMEEALRHRHLAAVLGEVGQLDLVASRRLQLAAEGLGVTGLLLRPPAPLPTPSAAVTRWRLASRASTERSGLDGPRWQVDLLRCRGGSPGGWLLEWNGTHLVDRSPPDSAAQQSTTEIPTRDQQLLNAS